MMNLRMKHGVRAALLACCAAAVCSGSLRAQDPAPQPQQGEGGAPMGGRNSPREMEQRRLDMMTKQLNLSPDQVTQVKAVMTQEREKMRALHEANAGQQQGGDREQMMAIRKDSQAKTRAILSDDQKTKYDDMQAHMRERQHRGGGPDGPGGPGGPPASAPGAPQM